MDQGKTGTSPTLVNRFSVQRSASGSLAAPAGTMDREITFGTPLPVVTGRPASWRGQVPW